MQRRRQPEKLRNSGRKAYGGRKGGELETYKYNNEKKKKRVKNYDSGRERKLNGNDNVT
ncbi:hypothetical protein L195_g060548 [Trifolium pratense]|uniref:Uncharacterized protein n=1 Tax=Trifolium pratense TaxID=57577 RepID=A0A2K3K4I3_TRIPR|nr:hypothetical protein L195_g060548 [Trifolium pratense]